MSEEASLDEFVDENSGGKELSDPDELEQEQFGPFILSTPGEWTAKRLGDIKQLITRGKQPTYSDEGVPVINQECIYWNGWHFENLRYLDEEVAKEWKEKYFPQEGDVIVNSTGQGTLGRAQVYPDEKRRAIDSHVTLLRADEQLHPHFYRYFLESHLGQALLYSMCVNGSTGQIELSKTRLDLLPTPLPPLKEQRKIASVLYNVDQAIQKTKEVIKQTSMVKQGLMQNLFRNGVDKSETKNLRRIGQVPKHWDVVKLEHVCRKITDGTHKSPPTIDEGYPYITSQNVRNWGFDLSDLKYISEEDHERITSRTNPEPDDVLYVKDGANTGNVNVNTLDFDFSLLSSVALIKPSRSKIKPWFLKYLFSWPKFRELVLSRMSGTGIRRLTISKLEKTDVLVPPIDEQEQIVDILDENYAYWENQQEILDQLKRLKRGLMQDLLSGTVRTTDADIEVLDEVKQHG